VETTQESTAENLARNLGQRAHPRCLQILLAEDVAASRLLVTRILEKRGHLVTAVSNGREAVTAFEGHAFDLVLMDLEMPVLDGLKATAAIRERGNAGAFHVPIIALTADSANKERTRCCSAGMDACLTKPLEMTTFIEVVEKLAEEGEPASRREDRGP